MNDAPLGQNGRRPSRKLQPALGLFTSSRMRVHVCTCVRAPLCVLCWGGCAYNSMESKNEQHWTGHRTHIRGDMPRWRWRWIILTTL